MTPRSWILMTASVAALFTLGSACDSGTSGAADTSGATDTSGAADTGELQDTAIAPPQDTTPQDTGIPEESAIVARGHQAIIDHIIDGDTVDVLVGNPVTTSFRVRLLGINAPECDKKRQTPSYSGDWRSACSDNRDFYYGYAAYQGLKTILDGQIIQLDCDNTAWGEECPKDDFDRYLAYLLVGGKDASTTMAIQGYAVSYTLFDSSRRAAICTAEYQARDAKRGMWALGSVSVVMDTLSSAPEGYWGWYLERHDRDCDRAIEN